MTWVDNGEEHAVADGWVTIIEEPWFPTLDTALDNPAAVEALFCANANGSLLHLRAAQLAYHADLARRLARQVARGVVPQDVSDAGPAWPPGYATWIVRMSDGEEARVWAPSAAFAADAVDGEVVSVYRALRGMDDTGTGTDTEETAP